jgi:hypothetical protein
MKRKHRCEEDRISSLPDCLLIEIISFLPETKYAIRTGTLSKRWQHLWPQVHNLIISHHLPFLIDSNEVPKDAFRFYLSLERIISQSNNPLNKFILGAFYIAQTYSQVNKCLRNAITRNVREVDLFLHMYACPDLFDWFLLPNFFFISSSFIHLTLSRCIFKHANVVRWKNLRTLRIEDTELDQDAIKKVLYGSPVLETLILDGCRGFELLDITNKSVKNLVFSWYTGYRSDSVEINAPYILSLTIQGCLRFEKRLLLNVSSAIKAELYNEKKLFRREFPKEYDELNEEMFKGILLSLGHTKEVKIGEGCLKVQLSFLLGNLCLSGCLDMCFGCD